MDGNSTKMENYGWELDKDDKLWVGTRQWFENVSQNPAFPSTEWVEKCSAAHNTELILILAKRIG